MAEVEGSTPFGSIEEIENEPANAIECEKVHFCQTGSKATLLGIQKDFWRGL